MRNAISQFQCPGLDSATRLLCVRTFVSSPYVHWISSGSAYANLPQVRMCMWWTLCSLQTLCDPDGKIKLLKINKLLLWTVYVPLLSLGHLLFFNFSFFPSILLIFMLFHGFIQRLFIRGSEVLKVLGDPPTQHFS